MATKATPRDPAVGTAVEIPEGLENGLLNYWYPLLPSRDLGTDKPKGIQRLGEELVLWRGSDGEPVLFVDCCPHRGALLSEGWFEQEGRLSCRYHGLQFDETGQCRRIPAERKEDGPQAKGLCVTAYPCEERNGFIWGYIGDVDRFPPPPLGLEPEVESEEYHTQPFELDYVWEAPWPLVMDNNIDLAHGTYLHWDTAAKYIPPEILLDYFTPINSRVEVVDGDIRLGGSRGRHIFIVDEDRKIETQSFFLPLSHRIDVGLGHEFPEGAMRLIVYIVPVNAERTRYYHHICVKKTLIEKTAFEEMFKSGLRMGMHEVYKQDVEITLGQKTTTRARSNEHLLPQDMMCVRVRRLILEAYQFQQDVSPSIR